MSIRKAELADVNTVKYIAAATISEIYPHYYPKGAVQFFMEHHNEHDIINDIKLNRVFLCVDTEEKIVGTVTIKGNEICRLFVLPEFQGKGQGKRMLDYAEKMISTEHSEIVLDASLPARKMYRKRGYKEIEFGVIKTNDNDFLCYDVMMKPI